jgi:hypothetical protein
MKKVQEKVLNNKELSEARQESKINLQENTPQTIISRKHHNEKKYTPHKKGSKP